MLSHLNCSLSLDWKSRFFSSGMAYLWSRRCNWLQEYGLNKDRDALRTLDMRRFVIFIINSSDREDANRSVWSSWTHVDGGTRPRMPSLSRSVRGKPRPLLNRGSLSRFFPVFLTISAFMNLPSTILPVMPLLWSPQELATLALKQQELWRLSEELKNITDGNTDGQSDFLSFCRSQK